MQRRTVIKDRNAETRLLTNRILVAVIGILVGIGVLLGRLFYLQVVSHQHFATLSQENRVKLVAIPPNRGLIYDRNGILLAGNRPSFRLVLTPEDVNDIEETLARLQEIIELSESDLNRFRELLPRSRRFEPIPLKFKLTEEEVARLAVNRHRFPGLDVRAELTRSYPWGELASHVIGYVGRISAQDLQRLEAQGKEANYRGTSHIGKLGIEHYYEDILHGQVGYEKVETNAVGRTIRVLERIAPVPGRDIHLSLDARLQAAAEAALEDYNGAIVAIDPRSGEVLAFVSRPTFDPNLFVNGIDLATYQAYQNDPNRPLYNRALRGEYPPASTVKPFIGLAALHHKVIGANESIYCPGHFTLPNVDHRYRDWKRGGHGRLNLNEAVAQSCDVYFYDVAMRLGIDDLSAFMSYFGFGAPTGIDLNGERTGILPSREWKRRTRNQPWYHGETVITGIGQGFWLATPLQMAQATATMANRGQRVVPHLLRAVSEPGSDRPVPVPRRTSGEPVPVHDAKLWDHAIESMKNVIRIGTARRVGIDLSYSMAGKTGTAQVRSIAQNERYDASKLERRFHDHGLFIAFAPIEAPEIAVAVVAENGGSGSGVAAPIARKVIDTYMENKARHAR